MKVLLLRLGILIFASLVLCGSHLSFAFKESSNCPFFVVVESLSKSGTFFPCPPFLVLFLPTLLGCSGVVSGALSVFPRRSQILIEGPRAEEEEVVVLVAVLY